MATAVDTTEKTPAKRQPGRRPSARVRRQASRGVPGAWADGVVKLLLVHDDPERCRQVRLKLKGTGWRAVLASARPEDCAETVGDHDVLLLDAGVIGTPAAERVGRRLPAAPVLILAGAGEEKAIRRGVEWGADDFIMEPFRPPELAMRIMALLHRRRPADLLVCGDVCLDRVQHLVSVRGDTPDLTPTEYRILELLMRTPGRVVRREELHRNVWHTPRRPGSNTLDVHVGHLRRKLDSAGTKECIRTIRGVGYAFDPESGPIRPGG